MFADCNLNVMGGSTCSTSDPSSTTCPTLVDDNDKNIWQGLMSSYITVSLSQPRRICSIEIVNPPVSDTYNCPHQIEVTTENNADLGTVRKQEIWGIYRHEEWPDIGTDVRLYDRRFI